MAAVYDSRHALAATTNPLLSREAPTDSHQALDKPLPSLPAPPSPTLTNPDMVLPNAGSLYAPSSPADSLRGPPSITYLRDITNQHAGGARASMDTDRPYLAKKEKRGLMSRKLMLLRSRTASNSREDVSQISPVRQGSPAEETSIASSPTIQDGDRLTPHSNVQDKRSSIGASSFNSDEYAALPAFLHKYRKDETEDEETDTEKPGSMRMGYSCSIAGGADARRKAQEEEEEHNSAMLSQRAEQILANAKKRLNLMEGNLRGARDLVAPLTAANLKRATSLGSSAASSTSNYGTKRFLTDGYTNKKPGTGRALHLQVSTPSLRREYNNGHSRTLSENTLPERPHTALMRGDMFERKGRIPVRPSNSSWSDLRGSKSHESLGSSPAQPTSIDGGSGRIGTSPAAMGTPDLDLEPLPEESASQMAPSVGNRESAHFEPEQTYGLGITRSPSTTDDLKGQMSTLKNRISSLRERAKEDSIRRQSFNNLRDASPLNNAEYQPPEMCYAGSSSTNGAEEAADNSPLKPHGGFPGWPSLPLKTKSRNAFAEMQQNARPTLRERRMQSHQDVPNYRPDNNRDMPGSFNIGDNDIASDVGAGADSFQYSGSDAPTVSTPGDPSEYFPDLEVESVYEDAEHDLPTSAVPHEEREDAFDYENFFLHSAMARYQQSSSPMDGDYDYDGESISTVSTAKGPRAIASEINPFDDELSPPPTPETPENLREIERRIAHSRKQSTDSVSTIASFATAAERHLSPTLTMHTTFSKSNSRRSSRASHFSRPSSNEPSLHRSSMSISSIAYRPPSDPLTNHRTSQPRRSQPLLSPLISPGTPLQDPTAIAVNALLNPNGRVLGLKDKALVFGVVESLRRVCEKLQEGDDEDAYELREWRRRLDGGRRELDGAVEQ